jgi:hypothetical protein
MALLPARTHIACLCVTMNTNTASVEVVRQEGLKFRPPQRQKSIQADGDGTCPLG